MNTFYSDLRLTYSRSTDEELLHLFLLDLTTLTPEAIPVLEDELYDRSLLDGLDVQTIIDVQLHPTRETIARMVEHLSRLPCPQCGTTNGTINAYEFPYENQYNQSKTKQYTLFIGCPACCSTVARQAIVGIIMDNLFNPFMLLFAIYQSIKIHLTIKQRYIPTPTVSFQRFAEQNAGAIVAYRTNPSALLALLCLPHFRHHSPSIFV